MEFAKNVFKFRAGEPRRGPRMEFAKDVFKSLLIILFLPAKFGIRIVRDVVRSVLGVEDTGRRMEDILAGIHVTNAEICKTNAWIRGTNSRIDESNAGIRETNAIIRETNAVIRETNAGIREINARIRGTNDRLDALLREFACYKKTVAVSQEYEVVQSVIQFFEGKGMEKDGPAYLGGEKIRDVFGEVLVEVDGLLYFKEREGAKRIAALVEVKNKVEKKALKQVKHAASILRQERGLDDVLIFVGGSDICWQSIGERIHEDLYFE